MKRLIAEAEVCANISFLFKKFHSYLNNSESHLL